MLVCSAVWEVEAKEMAPKSLLGSKWKTRQAMTSAAISSVRRLNNININIKLCLHTFYYSKSFALSLLG